MLVECDKHIILNRDIMIDDLNELKKCDCIYVDPPWGEGNLKYWRTMNGQKGFNINWKKFIERLFLLCKKHVQGPYLIEMGLRFIDDIILMFGEPEQIFYPYYLSGNKKYKNSILIYNAKVNVNLNNLNGFELISTALNNLNYKYEIKRIFDPCVGLGMTARFCKKYNKILMANELNLQRYEKTVKMLGESDVNQM